MWKNKEEISTPYRIIYSWGGFIMNKRDITEKYQYKKGLICYSSKHAKAIGDSYCERINTKENINNIILRLDSLVRYYDRFTYKLHQDDIENLEIEVGKYELALWEIIQNNAKFNYSVKEIIALTEKLDKYKKVVLNISIRKKCQS